MQKKRHDAFDHCILGEIGAMFWGLPEYVIDSIAAHHQAPQGGSNSFKISDIVCFANQLSHWVLLQPTQMNEEILESCYEKFGLESSDAEDLIAEIMPLKSGAA